MKYRVSEKKTPWEQWYEEGNIHFIKAPTESELITAYYGTVYGREIFDIRIDESFCTCKVKK